MLEVVKEELLLVNNEPAVAASYQSMVSPEPGVAEITTVPVPQRSASLAVGAAGSEFTVAVTAVRVAETQPLVVLRASA